jgi:hypothetical protein
MISKKALLEALKDEIPQHQKDLVKKYWGDKVLKMDVGEKTKVIPEGKWKLSEEDKETFLSNFFNVDLSSIKSSIESFNPDIHFWRVMIQAIEEPKVKESLKFKKYSSYSILHNIIKLNKIDVFYSLDVNAIKTGKVKMTDETGKPIIKDGKPVFVDYNDKNIPIFNKKRKTNFLNFIKSYNEAYNKNINYSFIEKILNSGVVEVLDSKNFDLDLFANKPMFLYITSKPEDTLNMSISRFYDSCQNLYSGGAKQSLITNVFDKNTKVCYIVYDQPFIDVGGNVVPFTSIARRLLRVVDEDGSVYFDTIYPNLDKRLSEVFTNLIKKYTNIKQLGYTWYKPNVPKNLPTAYLDTPLKYQRDDSKEEIIKKWIKKQYKGVSINSFRDMANRYYEGYRVSVTKENGDDRRLYFVKKVDLLSFSIHHFFSLVELSNGNLDYKNYFEYLKEDNLLSNMFIHFTDNRLRKDFLKQIDYNFEEITPSEKFINELKNKLTNVIKSNPKFSNISMIEKSLSLGDYFNTLAFLPQKNIKDKTIIDYLKNFYDIELKDSDDLNEFLNDNIDLDDLFSGYGEDEIYDMIVEGDNISLYEYIIRKEYEENKLFEIYNSYIDDENVDIKWNVQIDGEDFLIIETEIDREL